MNFLLRSLAILLPLAGLGYSWNSTRQTAAQGVEWDVPVTGYDPRDLLRGHYVRFRYVWPEDPASAMSEDYPAATRLCLEGAAPAIRRATRLADQDVASHCQGLARAPGQRGIPPQSSTIPRDGRLFIPQTDGPRLEHALADPKQQAILHFRLRPDGEIIPMRLSFQPKPSPRP